MRSVSLEIGEFYHVYNRGVDKRDIFTDQLDVDRFLLSLTEFNTAEPIGSIYEQSFVSKKKINQKRRHLVNIVCYCLNPNHFHVLVQQVHDGGIENFMHRLGTGYTRYFNGRHKRRGSLFEGTYKAVHVDSNDHLLHLSAYINLNYQAHQLGSLATKLTRSSWAEYLRIDTKPGICKTGIILKQFSNRKEYEQFARESLKNIIERKSLSKELEGYMGE